MTARSVTTQVAPGIWAAVADAAAVAPTASASTTTADCLPYQSTDEQDERTAAGLPPWRARQFLAGRALVRDLLGRVFPAAAAAPIRAGGTGKPELAGWPQIGISISHDGDRTAACVAEHYDVGIDIQSLDAPPRPAMLRRCVRGCSAQELMALTPGRQALTFAWIWTVQEACVKAEGTGLAAAPWSIDVPPGAANGTWRGLRWRKLPELGTTPTSCAWKEPNR